MNQLSGTHMWLRSLAAIQSCAGTLALQKTVSCKCGRPLLTWMHMQPALNDLAADLRRLLDLGLPASAPFSEAAAPCLH